MGKHKAKQPEPLDFSINHVIEEEEKAEAKRRAERLERKARKRSQLESAVEANPEDVQPMEKTHEENPRTFNSARSHASKFATYDEYIHTMARNSKCGLVAVKECRHLALPYHILNGNGMAGVRYICDRTIGKYRKPLNGVVFAIGDIELIGRPMAIDEQSGFHADFLVSTIVFKPETSPDLRVTVQHISKKFVSLTYMGAIQVKSFISLEKQVQLLGCHLELGDEVLVHVTATEVKGGLCTLVGHVKKILVRRTNKDDSFGFQNVKAPARKSLKFQEESEIPEIAETPAIKGKQKRESIIVSEASPEIEFVCETPKSKRVSVASLVETFSVDSEKAERRKAKKAQREEQSNGLPISREEIPTNGRSDEFVDITDRKRKRDRVYEAPPVEETPEPVPKKKSKREK
ncbi:unnamed protein product, partial [Mesorhabditis belari]|uniref:Uncharacterized protein n=1 Tax=Mesorhabditis belari TaxID=2138241 RepID=A0AAF3J4W6_9BILA